MAANMEQRRATYELSLVAVSESCPDVLAAVLGALQNQFHRLQESARGISIPDNLKHNISANLGNVRDFVGDFVPAARGADASDHVPDAAGSAPGASAAAAGAALPANEALRSDHGASSSAPPGSAAASQQAGSAAVELQASHEDAPMRHADASEPAELIADPDLEAYLKVRREMKRGRGHHPFGEWFVKHACMHLPSASSSPLCTNRLRQQFLSLVAGDGEQRSRRRRQPER